MTLFIAEKRKRNVFASHVVGVGDAKVGIKAVISGEEFGLIAEVPFPDAGGGVALLLKEFGDSCFLWG